MITKRVHFEDQGQDFLYWDIRDGKVVESYPFQGAIWGGKTVVNADSLAVGGNVRLDIGEPKMLCIKYPIKEIETLGKMERNTPCTIDQLQPGDRFYKAADKKKEVWQVVEAEAKRTSYRTYKFFAKRDTDRHPSPVNRSTPLVFLRNAKD